MPPQTWASTEIVGRFPAPVSKDAKDLDPVLVATFIRSSRRLFQLQKEQWVAVVTGVRATKVLSGG